MFSSAYFEESNYTSTHWARGGSDRLQSKCSDYFRPATGSSLVRGD